MKVSFYGRCELTTRETVLSDLQYQYEGTEGCWDDMMEYDIYSNDDGDYFAVPTGQKWECE